MAVRARILLVDDDPDIHALLGMALGPEGYELTSVTDGLQALECLRSATYDLVITDVNMPKLDGLELLQRIRQSAPNIHVLVMTAQNTADKVISALRNQAFSYFSKPFSPSAIVDMVDRALRPTSHPNEIRIISASPNWISLRVRCILENADRLAQFFRELSVGLPDGQQEDVATAFRELVMNAIEHGGHSDPEEWVEVSYMRLSRAILYCIRDPGEGFSFDELPHAAVSNTPENPAGHSEIREQLGMRAGGFGIFLTRQMADEVIYNQRGNEVMLVKYL